MRSKSKPLLTNLDGSLNVIEYSGEEELPLILFRKMVTKEELEKKYPRQRTESEQFIYDLIRMHGGGICD